MKEEYVTYPQAVKLKELGFKDKCNAYYWTEDKAFECTNSILHKNSDTCRTVVMAPFLWQAQKWLREKKKWHIVIEPRIWEQQVYDFKLWHYHRGYENANRGLDYISYELALSAGIDAALKLLTDTE